MTTRRPRRPNLQKAIEEARAAGMVVNRAEVLTDGRIILSTSEVIPEPDVLGDWMKKRESRAARHS